MPFDTPDFETPYKVAKQLKEEFGLDGAVVLGGEPSIYTAQTHKLLAKLSTLGIFTRLETNADWARDDESAYSFLEPLKAINTSVMFSLDAFHEPFISFENIMHAVKSCVKLGITYNLEIPYLDFKTKNNPLDKRTYELEQKAKSEIEDIQIYSGNVLFTGSAARTYGDKFSAGKGIPDKPCTKVPWWIDSDIETTELLYLEPGGWLTKGCGITIANIYKQDLSDIISNYKADASPVFRLLLKEGPIGLAREAEKYGYVIKKDYADQCHLCHEARQVLKSVYPDILQPDQHYK